MWKIKLFFQPFKQRSTISTHSLLSCRDKICRCGRTPAPLFIYNTHATATKFPTPFSHMLHRHHIRAINCLNFTINFKCSCPFCPQKLNNRSNLFCPHTPTVHYPLQKCVLQENCEAWATKVLPSSDQCLNFKWIKRHLTRWSYLVAIKEGNLFSNFSTYYNKKFERQTILIPLKLTQSVTSICRFHLIIY